MPSRQFSIPQHENSKLATQHPHSVKQPLAPPVLATPDNGNITEPALDFQGHKHVDLSEHGDQVYAIQDNELSSYTLFTMPGQGAANALREHLSKHLQADQVVDAYGQKCEMSEISNDHLAILQGKMWTKSANTCLATKATKPCRSRAQVFVAGHIAKISELLEGILSKAPTSLAEPDAA